MSITNVQGVGIKYLIPSSLLLDTEDSIQTIMPITRGLMMIILLLCYSILIDDRPAKIKSKI